MLLYWPIIAYTFFSHWCSHTSTDPKQLCKSWSLSWWQQTGGWQLTVGTARCSTREQGPPVPWWSHHSDQNQITGGLQSCHFDFYREITVKHPRPSALSRWHTFTVTGCGSFSFYSTVTFFSQLRGFTFALNMPSFSRFHLSVPSPFWPKLQSSKTHNLSTPK